MTWEQFGTTELAFIEGQQVGGLIEIENGIRCYAKRPGERIRSWDVSDRPAAKHIVARETA